MGLQCVIVLYFFTILHVLGDYTCMTPLGVPGHVVLIDECGPLHDLNRNDQKTDEEFLYLQQSIYNVTSDFKFNVCCPSTNKWSNTKDFHPIKYPEPNTTRISRKKYDVNDDGGDDDDEQDNYRYRPECKRTIAPPDPHKFCCGISKEIILDQSVNGLVYVSGFPWLVLLEYSNGMQLCGGSLISTRFVLTAAHCFTSLNGAPELVHLGNFDRTKAKTTDDTMTIPVESYFLHTHYDQEKHIHDIALIKLASFARYSADINPICLPTFDVVVSGAPYPGYFGVAGWGTTETGEFSARSLFTAVPYANHSECQKYHTHKIHPEQICAGGGAGDSCGGDSGGPLEMLDPDTRKYSLAGVVSFGSRHCGQLGNPSVYTNVFRYKDWIYNLTKEIQADFEGRNPEDCDFHGIKQLLRQLFLKANVELGQLAQLIIGQNYIGSVVKQCLDEGQEDDDEDDGSDGVFGITTVINITKRKNENCIAQLRTLLNTLAEENANDRTKALVKKILSDDNNDVGFVINERILNIPAQISVPLFASLQNELEKAVRKNMPYTFQYLVWITKTYNTGDDAADVLFANQEEKPIVDEALASFDVDVTDQADLSQWDYEGGAMTPCRKVLIFEGKKLDHLMRLIKEEVQSV